MCGQRLWKGVIVFGLAFGLSVFVSNLFTLRSATMMFCPAVKKELPPENQNSGNTSVSETKNCVPIDGSLKYRTLEDKEPANFQFQIEKTPQLAVKETEADKKSTKNKRETQHSNGKTARSFEQSPIDTDAVRDVRHREKSVAPPAPK